MSIDARTPFTFGSLYSGGGGADVGLVAAGGLPVFAVEHDAEIAGVYRTNLGTHIIAGDAANFGVAQTRRRLIVRAVRGSLVPHLPPPVRPWVGWYAAIEDLLPTLPGSAFASWQLARLPALLTDTLVHDTEMRAMPIRAGDEPCFTLRGSSKNKNPTNVPRAFLVSNAATEYGTGVAGAADPAWSVTGESAGRVRALLVRGDNTQQEWGKGYRGDDEPAVTVRAIDRPSHWPRAFIADGRLGDMSTSMTTRDADEPMFTVNRMEKQACKAWLECGRVVAMTPRALARFQSVPDNYILPDRRALAARVLGNMVPPLLAQRLAEGLMEALR